MWLATFRNLCCDCRYVEVYATDLQDPYNEPTPRHIIVRLMRYSGGVKSTQIGPSKVLIADVRSCVKRSVAAVPVVTMDRTPAAASMRRRGLMAPESTGDQKTEYPAAWRNRSVGRNSHDI
jgi:hypothetical protein